MRDDSRPGDPPEAAPPEAVREGVRQGIVDALALEVDRTQSATAARLAAAGALGLGAAVGSIVLFSGSALHSGHGLHLALCAAAWAGLLVEFFVLVLLRVRARNLPLAQAAALALVGLALAAVLGFVCPDPHYLDWWMSTELGHRFAMHTGVSGSALCLGICSALLIGVGASLVLTLRGIEFRSAGLPSLFLFLLLWPAVVLQSASGDFAHFVSWSIGLFVGAYAGILLGLLPVRLLRTRLPQAGVGHGSSD